MSSSRISKERMHIDNDTWKKILSAVKEVEGGQEKYAKKSGSKWSVVREALPRDFTLTAREISIKFGNVMCEVRGTRKRRRFIGNISPEVMKMFREHLVSKGFIPPEVPNGRNLRNGNDVKAGKEDEQRKFVNVTKEDVSQKNVKALHKAEVIDSRDNHVEVGWRRKIEVGSEMAPAHISGDVIGRDEDSHSIYTARDKDSHSFYTACEVFSSKETACEVFSSKETLDTDCFSPFDQEWDEIEEWIRERLIPTSKKKIREVIEKEFGTERFAALLEEPSSRSRIEGPIQVAFAQLQAQITIEVKSTTTALSHRVVKELMK